MREINWDEPLSDEDKAWARQASLPMVEDRIAANERQFGEDSSLEQGQVIPADTITRSALDPAARANEGVVATGSTVPVEEPGAADDYDQWKVQELREEAATRTPPVELSSDARKPDIIAALRQWDRDHPEEA